MLNPTRQFDIYDIYYNAWLRTAEQAAPPVAVNQTCRLPYDEKSNDKK
jgi:hypothetical protein